MAQVIQQLVAPAVMISACGLLCLAQYARFAAIVARLHQFHHERFEVYVKMTKSQGPEKQLLEARSEGINEQADHILERAQKTRHVLICLTGCILFMIVSSLAIGLSLMIETFQSLVVGFFILGVLSMAVAMIVALAELRSSLKEVQYEHERIKRLGSSDLAMYPSTLPESNL